MFGGNITPAVEEMAAFAARARQHLGQAPAALPSDAWLGGLAPLQNRNANMNDEELVLVYVSQGPLGAEVARTKLEAEGLPVVVRYSALGRALGLTFNGLGQVEVWVRPPTPPRLAPSWRKRTRTSAPWCRAKPPAERPHRPRVARRGEEGQD